MPSVPVLAVGFQEGLGGARAGLIAARAMAPMAEVAVVTVAVALITAMVVITMTVSTGISVGVGVGVSTSVLELGGLASEFLLGCM